MLPGPSQEESVAHKILMFLMKRSEEIQDIQVNAMQFMASKEILVLVSAGKLQTFLVCLLAAFVFTKEKLVSYYFMMS